MVNNEVIGPLSRSMATSPPFRNIKEQLSSTKQKSRHSFFPPIKLLGAAARPQLHRNRIRPAFPLGFENFSFAN
jgi:hypothetical protein